MYKTLCQTPGGGPRCVAGCCILGGPASSQTVHCAPVWPHRARPRSHSTTSESLASSPGSALLHVAPLAQRIKESHAAVRPRSHRTTRNAWLQP